MSAVIEGVGGAQRMRADLEAKGEGNEARCGSSGPSILPLPAEL